MKTEHDRWAVVGGGFLGMTIALRLAQKGRTVTLFEAADRLGGLASAWRLGEVVWDRHYHVTLLSDTFLRALLAELDLEGELKWVETRTGFFTDNRLYSMSNTFEFLRFPPLSLLDKLRLGVTIFYASRIRDWRRLEKISVGAWLKRYSGRRTYEKIWLPLLRAKLGENYRKASAAFIWAIIARMYKARRTGLKKEMFGYVHGGYARVLEVFARRLGKSGVSIRVGQPVERVDEDSQGRIVVSLPGGNRQAFDQVVVTQAAPLAARLCPGLTAEERDSREAVDYQGIICASMLLKKPLAGYYVTNITDDWVPFTAVIEMSALVDPRELGGYSLVYLPKYVDPQDPMFELSDGEIESSFWSALRKMYPSLTDDDLVSCRISRVKHVLAISTLNYSKTMPPMHTSIPGLYLVNSSHIVNGTLNVNETLQLAERCAAMLLSRPRLRVEAPIRRAV